MFLTRLFEVDVIGQEKKYSSIPNTGHLLSIYACFFCFSRCAIIPITIILSGYSVQHPSLLKTHQVLNSPNSTLSRVQRLNFIVHITHSGVPNK